MKDIAALREVFKHLINHRLPATYAQPVRYNHCFNRVILDWLFTGCWYNHLDKNRTALSQLSAQQLETSIERMNGWLNDQSLLVNDNLASLGYRQNKKRV